MPTPLPTTYQLLHYLLATTHYPPTQMSAKECLPCIDMTQLLGSGLLEALLPRRLRGRLLTDATWVRFVCVCVRHGGLCTRAGGQGSDPFATMSFSCVCVWLGLRLALSGKIQSIVWLEFGASCQGLCIARQRSEEFGTGAVRLGLGDLCHGRSGCNHTLFMLPWNQRNCPFLKGT